PGAACRVQVGQVVGVDAHAHLDGHRHVSSASLFGGGRDDGAEQVGLPGEHRSPALAGDLGYRATEVEVDVVGAVLLDEHPHRTTYRDRVHAVELDTAHALAGVVGNDLHRLLVALQQGAGGHHLGHVQARGRRTIGELGEPFHRQPGRTCLTAQPP